MKDFMQKTGYPLIIMIGIIILVKGVLPIPGLKVLPLLSDLTFIRSIENALLDVRFQVKTSYSDFAEESVYSDIMILGIDEESQSDKFLGVYPWPRNVYANFLRYFRLPEVDREVVYNQLMEAYGPDAPPVFRFEQMMKMFDGNISPDMIFFDLFFDLYRPPQIFNQNYNLYSETFYVNKEVLPAVYSLLLKEYEDIAGENLDEFINPLKEEIELLNEKLNEARQAKRELEQRLQNVQGEGQSGGAGGDGLLLAQNDQGTSSDGVLIIDGNSSDSDVIETDSEDDLPANPPNQQSTSPSTQNILDDAVEIIQDDQGSQNNEIIIEGGQGEIIIDQSGVVENTPADSQTNANNNVVSGQQQNPLEEFDFEEYFSLHTTEFNFGDWQEADKETFINTLMNIYSIGDEVFFKEIKLLIEERNVEIFIDYYTQYGGTTALGYEEELKRWEKMNDFIIPVSDPPGENYSDKLNVVTGISAPLPEILGTVTAVGAAVVEQDIDSRIRYMPTVFKTLPPTEQYMELDEYGFVVDESGVVESDEETEEKQHNFEYLATIDTVILLSYLGVEPEEYQEMVLDEETGEMVPRVQLILGDGFYVRNARMPYKEKVEEDSPERGIQGFETFNYWKTLGYKEIDLFYFPVDERGRVLINYQGGHHSFEQYPFYMISQVVYKAYEDSHLPLQDLGYQNAQNYINRVIFIGFSTSAGLGEGKDYFETPVGTMYGIEIHANAFYTMLMRDYINETGFWFNFLLQFLMAIALTLTIPRISILKGSLVFGIIIVLFFFINVLYLFPDQLIYINMIDAMLIVLFVFLGLIVYKVLYEEKEGRRVKGMFSNYVNAEVVDELMKNPEKLQLGGVDKEITVLFSDIRGFTTLSEGLTPQELVSHLNEYLSAMTDIVFQYRGTLDKYVGDEIMAFWGAPVELPDHAIQACKAALEMMRVLEELNKGWPDKKKLKIGIGLNTGIMTVGNMGSEVRKDYTLMGDNVNLGARLEGVNKMYSTNIIISEFTYEIVKDHVIARELDLIRVKGKNKPVKIFELCGMKDGKWEYINQFTQGQ